MWLMLGARRVLRAKGPRVGRGGGLAAAAIYIACDARFREPRARDRGRPVGRDLRRAAGVAHGRTGADHSLQKSDHRRCRQSLRRRQIPLATAPHQLQSNARCRRTTTGPGCGSRSHKSLISPRFSSGRDFRTGSSKTTATASASRFATCASRGAPRIFCDDIHPQRNARAMAGALDATRTTDSFVFGRRVQRTSDAQTVIVRAAHARPHDRLGHTTSAQDHGLHARDDAVSDAVLPGGSVLGRAAREGSGRRRQRRRQPRLHRPCGDADAERRRDHARVARGRTEGPRGSGLRGESVPRPGDRVRTALSRHRDDAPRSLRAELVGRRGHGRPGRRVSPLVHSRDGAAVSDGLDERGAARHGQLQARHDRADQHGHHQHGARAAADVRRGNRASARRRRRGDCLADRNCHRHHLARDVFQRGRLSADPAVPSSAARPGMARHVEESAFLPARSSR